MIRAEELRGKAEHYRQLALSLTDQRTIDALNDLAAEYEATAARLERGEGMCASATE
jgi:hypothetical protein